MRIVVVVLPNSIFCLRRSINVQRERLSVPSIVANSIGRFSKIFNKSVRALEKEDIAPTARIRVYFGFILWIKKNKRKKETNKQI